MNKTITINDIQVNILCVQGIGVKYVSIVPVKLNLPVIRTKDEVYLVSSAKRGNTIRKNPTPIGFIVKSRKRCSFLSTFNTNLCLETIELVNIIMNRVNDCELYYDFRNNKWPKYLIDDIKERAQKAKELDQRAKELNKLKDDVNDIKKSLSAVMEGLANVCNQD